MSSSANESASEDITDAPFELSIAEGKENVPDTSTILCETSFLQNIINDLSPSCNQCGSKNIKLEEENSKRKGLSREFSVICHDCNGILTTRNTSSNIKDTKHKLLNVRAVEAAKRCGFGKASLDTFFATMEHPNPVLQSSAFHKILGHIHTALMSEKQQFLEVSHKKIRGVLSELNEDVSQPILDIDICYDGSWMTRGFSSNIGIGFVIELVTGLIIDFEVLCRYCHACTLAEKKFGTKSDHFKKWYKKHEDKCSINYSGSSGAMETEIFKLLCLRSKDHGFQYVSVLGDGDCKTIDAINALKPYGNEISLTKMECTNHVSKRFGKHLRETVKNKKLGGVKKTMTATRISWWTTYYSWAIKDNHNVKDMQDAIMAILFHSMERPSHLHCSSRWCWYKKSLTNGDSTEKTDVDVEPKSKFPPVPREVATQLMPVFRLLSNESLLEKCILKGTTNQNESLHNVVWKNCPKTSMWSRYSVESATVRAAMSFNMGSKAMTSRIGDCLNLETTPHSVSHSKNKDRMRLYYAKRQINPEHKVQRKGRKKTKLAKEEALETAEGGKQYVPGGDRVPTPNDKC